MEKRILVIGASGSQGGEVLKCLQKSAFKLRTFTRKESEFTKRVRAEGVEIALGNLDDENSLIKAMDNVYGVFSVLAASLQKDKEQKIKHSQTLVTACEKEGVQVLVNSSVVRAGDEKNFKNWENYKNYYPFLYLYWVNKGGSVKVIKETKLPH